MLAPTLVTPPALMPISLEDAKLHLRVDGGDEDDFINAIIAAAVGYLDGYAGILGRCLSPQTWSQEYEAPSGDLVLPLSPVTSILSVTGDFSDYRLLQDGRGYFLRLNDGACWPSGPVTVEFSAGYVDVPKPLLHAMKLHIGTMYQYRETLGEKAMPNMAFEALIAPYRTNGV